MDKRKLLQGFFFGIVGQNELKKAMNGPKIICCGITPPDGKRPAGGEYSPETPVTVIIDGRPYEMTFAEYQQLCRDNPQATIIKPLAFVNQSE